MKQKIYKIIAYFMGTITALLVVLNLALITARAADTTSYDVTFSLEFEYPNSRPVQISYSKTLSPEFRNCIIINDFAYSNHLYTDIVTGYYNVDTGYFYTNANKVSGTLHYLDTDSTSNAFRGTTEAMWGTRLTEVSNADVFLFPESLASSVSLYSNGANVNDFIPVQAPFIPEVPSSGSFDSLFGGDAFNYKDYTYWFLTDGQETFTHGNTTVWSNKFGIELDNDLVKSGQYKKLVGTFTVDFDRACPVLSLYYLNDNNEFIPCNGFNCFFGLSGVWGYTGWFHVFGNYMYFNDGDLDFTVHMGTRVISSNFDFYQANLIDSSSPEEGFKPTGNNTSDITIIGGGGGSSGNISLDGNSFDLTEFLNGQYMQGFLSILSQFFAFLPPWLWSLLGFAFTVFTVMAIYKFIRG